MRRLLLPALASFVLWTGAARADGETLLLARCGGPFQLCGYTADDGVLQIAQQFEVAGRFSEGLAAVRVEGRFGYIDASGSMVIPPRFEAAGPFSGGFAEVRIDGASGAIDRTGRLVVPATFGRMLPFASSTFIAEPLGDKTTSEIDIHRLDTMAMPMSDFGPAGLYHLLRGWLTGQDLEFRLFDEPVRGLIWARRRTGEQDGLWGLMQADGAWRVPPQYSDVQSLNETRAIVEIPGDPSLPPEEQRKAARQGAVDPDGRLVVPTRFPHLFYWRGGYGIAQDSHDPKGRAAIVTADGSLLGGRYFDAVDVSDEGHLPRVRVDTAWFSITPAGEFVEDQREGEILLECAGGVSIFRRGEQVAFMGSGGRAVPGSYDTAFYRDADCPGPFAARRDGRWFYILESGTVLGGDRGFEDLAGFIGAHAAVRLDGKWGIIDRTGKFTVPPRHDTLRPDRDRFRVIEGIKTYWIDASGTRVAPPTVEQPTPAQRLTCPGGLRFFQQGGRWGLEDQSGRIVIAPRFRALSCFSEGVSWAAESGGTGWCAIGADGRRRTAMACRQTYYPYMVSHAFPERLAEDPYESSVLWNIAMLEHLAGMRAQPPRWIGDGVQSRLSGSLTP